MKNNFSIDIASPPDRENLVCEIFYNNNQVAEILNENNILEIELYPNQRNKPWKFSFDEFLKCLNDGKERISNISTN